MVRATSPGRRPRPPTQAPPGASSESQAAAAALRRVTRTGILRPFRRAELSVGNRLPGPPTVTVPVQGLGVQVSSSLMLKFDSRPRLGPGRQVALGVNLASSVSTAPAKVTSRP